MEEPRKPADNWQSGDAYEPFIGRWSRLVAQRFVPWLSVPPKSRWLDVGCGTGCLTQAILGLADPAEVLGVDRSPGFLETARNRTADPRASFGVADAERLDLERDHFDAAISGLVLNFIGCPEVTMSQMCDAVRGGGVVAAYVWDYAGEMQMLRRFWDAAISLDVSAASIDEAVRFPLCNPKALSALFANLVDVESLVIDVPTVFQNFDDYWEPFLGGQGPAPTYVASLSEEHREQLREGLRNSLPSAPDGSIHLVARAWAVRGKKPA